MNLQRSHWAVYFIFWLLAIVVGSALIGAISFPLLGPVFGSKLTSRQLVIAGLQHLSFIALIWAPGVALVLSVIRAHRSKTPQ